MASYDKQVADTIRRKKIRELARSIRRKYLSLKLGKSEEDEALDKIFRPVTIPLKQLVSNTTSSSSSKPIAPATIGIKKEKVKKEEEEEDEDAKTSSEMEISQSDDPEQQPIAEFLSQYPAIAHPYIIEFYNQSPKIDKTYGPSYDESAAKWKLGQKYITFVKKTGNIVVERREFKGTSGLYQLIFYDNAQCNDEDKKQYKNLLDMTAVHRKTNGALKSSNTTKYHDIIRPLFFQSRGGALRSELVYNTKPLEYIYWDDPNELVERLKLLIASKDAGNTSHDNEIIAIINELKEAKIIVGESNKMHSKMSTVSVHHG